MKRRLITTALTFLFTLVFSGAAAQADDAASKKQLVGSWKGPYGQTIVLKESGVATNSERDAPGKWDVRDGVLLIKYHRQDSFKILSLTKTKLEIQDMYHGRHKGTWTRKASAPLARATPGESAEKQSIPDGVTIPHETHSPNGRYGVTVTPFDAIKKGQKPQNYLADLQNETVLCRMETELAWDGGQYGTTPVARWSPDSSLLIWEVPNKWFPSGVAIVQIHDGRVQWQLDLLRQAQDAILTRTREAAPEKYAAIKNRASQFGAAYHDGFSIDVQPLAPPVALPLKVRVVLTSNPKRLEDYPTLDSHLEGLVNAAGEFSVTNFALESIASRTWSAAPAPASTGGNSSPFGDTSGLEEFIRDFYASYVAPRFWDNRKEMSKFLSKPLVNGMIKASQRDLDIAHPIIPGNGYDEKEILRTLAVQPFFTERGAACLATFNTFGKKNSVTYLLTKENGKWLISDVIGSGGQSYLKSLPR